MGESLRLKLSHDNSRPGLSNPKHGFLVSSKNVISAENSLSTQSVTQWVYNTCGTRGQTSAGRGQADIGYGLGISTVEEWLREHSRVAVFTARVEN